VIENKGLENYGKVKSNKGKKLEGEIREEYQKKELSLRRDVFMPLYISNYTIL
jgi:hypothetical protein